VSRHTLTAHVEQPGRTRGYLLAFVLLGLSLLLGYTVTFTWQQPPVG
jgi:hypothetical protein